MSTRSAVASISLCYGSILNLFVCVCLFHVCSVAKVLHIYRSGKLPKAFKIIPALTNWEEVLYLTQPDEWSDQAMMAATKLFASNLNAKMAQRCVTARCLVCCRIVVWCGVALLNSFCCEHRFYNLVLLPRVRDQIEQTHKLSFHLYMSLKMSLFKPSAFFKVTRYRPCVFVASVAHSIAQGILLPLCERVMHAA